MAVASERKRKAAELNARSRSVYHNSGRFVLDLAEAARQR